MQARRSRRRAARPTWIALLAGALLLGGAAGLLQAEPASPATQPAPDAPPTTRTRPAGDEPPAAQPEARQKTFVNTVGPGRKYSIGAKDPRTGYKFRIEATNRGAAVYTVKLSEFFATVDDKQLFEEDPDGYDRRRLEDPQKYRGHYSLLNPVTREKKQYLPFTTRKVAYQIQGRTGLIEVPLADQGWRLAAPEEPETRPRGAATQPAGPETRPEDPGTDSLSFRCRIFRGPDLRQARDRPVLELTKTYTVEKDSYSFTVALTARNLADEPVRVFVDQYGPTGMPREGGQRGDRRTYAYGQLLAGENEVRVSLKHGFGDIQQLKAGEEADVGRSDDSNPILWAGQINKYFGCLAYLRPHEENRLAAEGDNAEYYLTTAWESPHSKTQVAGTRLGVVGEKQGLLLNPEGQSGDRHTFSFDVFAGPKKRSLLSDHPLYGKLKYFETIDVSSCCHCSFDWLALAMIWLLVHLKTYVTLNYGLAIILLVIVVRIILHPLTKKSQVSMSKMQKLAPQMKEIQEKYKDDKAAMNREMMKLYRQTGASPFLGCLPMLLQMPIWIALWTGINAAVELRHAAFLPFWLTDLSAPDQLFTWSRPLPFIGTSFNLLPILLAVAMFLQTKLNPQMTGGASMSPQQQSQQKLMRVLFPGMMLLIFYGMASGVTLYVMASMFGGVFEQYVIRKHIREREAAEAATETTVSAPGRKSRSQRPKKPKGPFWHRHG